MLVCSYRHSRITFNDKIHLGILFLEIKIIAVITKKKKEVCLIVSFLSILKYYQAWNGYRITNKNMVPRRTNHRAIFPFFRMFCSATGLNCKFSAGIPEAHSKRFPFVPTKHTEFLEKTSFVFS